MTWVFMRHAETTANIMMNRKSFNKQGCLKLADYQINLTKRGVIQAHRSGVKLRKKFGVFNRIIHTGYKRSKDTADYILQAYSPDELAQINVTRNFYLRERESGYSALIPEKEFVKFFPWMGEHRQINGLLFTRPPGGESLTDVVDRVNHGLEGLLKNSIQDNILFVVHGWTLASVRFILEDWTYEEMEKYLSGKPVGNCEAVIYHYDQELDRLIYSNNCSFV